MITRVTGFGQFGPYSGRPGFGTLAEAMSGFAAMTGEPDGPPTLPPFGLADGITALATAAATMFALRARDQNGKGQVVDMAIIEPILTILGPQPLWFDQFGIVQERRGQPLGEQRAAQHVQDRGRPMGGDLDLRAEHRRARDDAGRPSGGHRRAVVQVGRRARQARRRARRDGGRLDRAATRSIEVMREFEAAEAAVAPIYDIRHIMADPQFQALKTIIPVDDPELGPIKMQNVMFRLSETPGRIKWTGRNPGADNADVYGRMLGLDAAAHGRLEGARGDLMTAGRARRRRAARICSRRGATSASSRRSSMPAPTPSSWISRTRWRRTRRRPPAAWWLAAAGRAP